MPLCKLIVLKGLVTCSGGDPVLIAVSKDGKLIGECRIEEQGVFSKTLLNLNSDLNTEGLYRIRIRSEGITLTRIGRVSLEVISDDDSTRSVHVGGAGPIAILNQGGVNSRQFAVELEAAEAA